jgi:hypothetical protein
MMEPLRGSGAMIVIIPRIDGTAPRFLKFMELTADKQRAIYS